MTNNSSINALSEEGEGETFSETEGREPHQGEPPKKKLENQKIRLTDRFLPVQKDFSSNLTDQSDQILDRCEPDHFVQNTFVSEYTPEKFVQLQEECKELAPLILYLKSGILPTDKRLARKILIFSENHDFDENGILCQYKLTTNKKLMAVQDSMWRRVLPVSLREQLISEAHSQHHSGVAITFELISREFYWPGMVSQIKKHVLSCKICISSKRGMPKKGVLLKPLEIPPYPFYSLSLDFLEGLPETKDAFVTWWRWSAIFLGTPSCLL